MNNLQIFDFKQNSIRAIVDKDNNPMFNAADICNSLGIVNHRDACGRLDDDEKGVALTDTLGGKQDVLMVNESGLYSLIFTSNKPEAKAFRKWVTSEVLPSIRKTGEYKLNKRVDILESLLTSKQRHTANVLDNIDFLIDLYFDWSTSIENWSAYNIYDIYYEACMGDVFVKAMPIHLTAIKNCLKNRGVCAVNGNVFLMPKPRQEI